jgi:hypothetical protein
VLFVFFFLRMLLLVLFYLLFLVLFLVLFLMLFFLFILLLGWGSVFLHKLIHKRILLGKSCLVGGN